MTRFNTGPPFYAKDQGEANRALLHRQNVGKRASFASMIQARLRGNTAKEVDLLFNTEPIRKD
jgi:hypothetical protein